MTVEIGGSTAGLSAALKDIRKEAGDTQRELSEINKLLKFDPENTVLQAQKLAALGDAVKIASEKVEAFHQAHEKVDELFRKGEIDADAYNNFTRQLIQAEQELEKAEKAQKNYTSSLDTLGDEADQTAKEVKQLGEKTEDSADKAEKSKDKWDKLGSVLGTVGKAVGVAVTAISGALAAAGKEAFQIGMEYESAFAGVKKTVDATDEQLAALSDGIRNMAMEIPATTTEIAGVAEAAGQLGIATDDILDFTRVMIDLGESTNLSADEAASSLAKLANITGMQAEDYSRLGAAIVDLGNHFATTEADIVAMTTRLASTGAVVGLSEAQMLAVATALSAVGIEAEAGGSAISKLMKNMEVSVKTYDGAVEMIERTGRSLRNLELLEANGSKYFKMAADEIGVTSTELSKAIDTVRKMEQYSSIAGQSIDEFIDAWGNDAVVAMDSFITGLGNSEAAGKSAVEVLQEMGLTEIRLSNAVLALASSGGILTEAVNTSNTAWSENTALTNEAEQRYATMESQLAILANTARDFGITLYESMTNPITGLIDFANEQLVLLSDAFRNEGMEGLLAALDEVIANVVTYIADHAETVIDTSLEILFSLVDALLANLDKLTEAASGIVLTLVQKIIEYLPELVKAAVEIVTMLAADIGEALPELIPAAVEAVRSIVAGLIDNVGLLVDAAIALILGLADGLMAALPELSEKAPEIVVSLVNGIVENLPKLTEAAVELIVTLTEGLADNTEVVIDAGFAVMEALWDTITEVDWLELGGNIMNGIMDGILAGIRGIGNVLSKVKDGIVGGFKELFDINSPSKVMADEIGFNLADGIGVGFMDEIDRVAKDMAESLPLSEFGHDIQTVFHGSYDRDYYEDINITMPILLDGKPIAERTSKLQRNMSVGRYRAAGVSV